MPPEGHGVRLRPRGEPQGEDADDDAAEVRQEMSRVRHDGQTLSRVPPCREDIIYMRVCVY